MNSEVFVFFVMLLAIVVSDYPTLLFVSCFSVDCSVVGVFIIRCLFCSSHLVSFKSSQEPLARALGLCSEELHVATPTATHPDFT